MSKKNKAADLIYKEAKKLCATLKKQGAEVTMKPSGSTLDAELWVSTGSTLLDGLLTHTFNPRLRGIPIGRVIDVVGPPGAGKSTLLAHLFSEVHKVGGITMLLVSEGERCAERMEAIGVNFTQHITLPVNDLLDGFVWIIESVKKKSDNVPMVIGWDTVSAAPDPLSREALDKADTTSKIRDAITMKTSGLSAKARAIREQLRNITNMLHRKHVTLVFVQQKIEKPGMAQSWIDYQPQTSGGKGIWYHSSLRLHVAGGPQWKDTDGNVIGIHSGISVIKSKLVMPMRRVYVPLRFATGIDDVQGIINYLADAKVLSHKGGGWREFKAADGKTRKFRYPTDLTGEEILHLRNLVLEKLSPAHYLGGTNDSANI